MQIRKFGEAQATETTREELGFNWSFWNRENRRAIFSRRRLNVWFLGMEINGIYWPPWSLTLLGGDW